MGVFSELKPINHARKNPFDLSSTLMYNQKAGMIVPIKAIPTLPSSTYKIDLKALLRTQPLQTAAFAGFSINYDVMWTPYNDHYSSFNQFIAQRLNKQHATQPDIQKIPNFSLKGFVSNLLPLCVYDYLWSLYPLDLSDNTGTPPVYGVGYPDVLPQGCIVFSDQCPEESLALSCLRTLDMLEDGNYLPLVKRCVSQLVNLVEDSSMYTTAADKGKYHPALLVLALAHNIVNNNTVKFPTMSTWLSTESTNIDFDYIQNYYYHICKYGITVSSIIRVKDLFTCLNSGFVSLWPVFCYNKAFWQFYRNEYYDERFDYRTKDTFTSSNHEYVDYVYLFNWDDFSTTLDESYFNTHQGVDSPIANFYARLIAMFGLKYHQYKKDYYTAVLPSTQYGDVAVASAEDVFAKLVSNIHASSSVSVDNGQVFTNANNLLYATSGAGTATSKGEKYKFDPAPMISVLEMRRADSLQRFKERMMRAGNKTKDIFKAHGWDEPLSEKAFDVHFLGNFDGRLDINVVASTTETSNINLGQLASNGVGVINGESIKFESHDFGCLLVVAYIVKDALYDSYGIHKSHTLLEPFDFPYPELQNISLAPVTKSQVDAFVGSDNPNTVVVGYLPQNMCYKTQVDQVHGEFYSAPILANNYVPVPNGSILDVGQGIFANMVTPRKDISVPESLDFIYCQPSCADNIFVQSATVAQDSDQFFGVVNLDIKTVQPLDVIGLPI